jgi:hypothetical protein
MTSKKRTALTDPKNVAMVWNSDETTAALAGAPRRTPVKKAKATRKARRKAS